ncbi:uncharacterized protein LOC141857652 [Brevipalpus obovatus]|uniref:uncharacterized protein LOC141857652 n=1 Tax=Brevipalpus obovatus TaxID=246614 RepID=UPI003D9DCB92
MFTVNEKEFGLDMISWIETMVRGEIFFAHQTHVLLHGPIKIDGYNGPEHGLDIELFLRIKTIELQIFINSLLLVPSFLNQLSKCLVVQVLIVLPNVAQILAATVLPTDAIVATVVQDDKINAAHDVVVIHADAVKLAKVVADVIVADAPTALVDHHVDVADAVPNLNASRLDQNDWISRNFTEINMAQEMLIHGARPFCQLNMSL